MASYEIFITFGIYLVFLMAIGVYFYSKTTTHESYVLGDRGVGYWVTAMSAQASDMSGWLLLGLPGAVYMSGLTEIWVVIGLALGTYLNWKFVAPALRIQTEKYNSLTIPSFISQKLNDNKGYIRTFSAIVILFFFTIYSASGLVASGKLFIGDLRRGDSFRARRFGIIDLGAADGVLSAYFGRLRANAIRLLSDETGVGSE